MPNVLAQTGTLDSAIAGAKLMLDYLAKLKETGTAPEPQEFFKKETAMEDLVSLANLSAITGAVALEAMEIGNIVPVTIEPITGMVS